MISAALWYAVRLCHSVRSCHSPALSLKRSEVARVRLATGKPLGKNLTSGSLPTLPRRMTLLTLFAMMFLLFWVRQKHSRTYSAALLVEPRPRRRLRSHLAAPSSVSMVPKGRHIIASSSESQPELVCGPCSPMPPKTVAVKSAATPPTSKIQMPACSSCRVPSSGISLPPCSEHSVHHHPGDGDVEPDGQRKLGQLAVLPEAPAEREKEGRQHHRQRHDR